MPKGGNQDDTHGGKDAASKRPFLTGITVKSLGDIPSGCSCTWVPKGGKFALKFVNNGCSKHRGK